nr:hypothetical protein CFP56_57658 [Quercus suber]
MHLARLLCTALIGASSVVALQSPHRKAPVKAKRSLSPGSQFKPHHPHHEPKHCNEKTASQRRLRGRRVLCGTTLDRLECDERECAVVLVLSVREQGCRRRNRDLAQWRSRVQLSGWFSPGEWTHFLVSEHVHPEDEQPLTRRSQLGNPALIVRSRIHIRG